MMLLWTAGFVHRSQSMEGRNAFYDPGVRGGGLAFNEFYDRAGATKVDVQVV